LCDIAPATLRQGRPILLARLAGGGYIFAMDASPQSRREGPDWAALDALPDPVVVLDDDWRVRYATPAAERLLGVRPAPGAAVLDAFPMLRATPLEQRLREAAERRETVRFSTRYADERVRGHFDVVVAPVAGGLLVHLRERTPLPGGEEQVSRGLVEAGMALSSALSLEQVLQVLADTAREVVSARYAALGVIDETGTGLSNFIVSGVTREQRARLGHLPRGHGLLGLLIREPRPIRVREISEHPDSAGVPPGHPDMHSFLGVPVMGRGRVFGNLYVTEKIGRDEFTAEDVALLETLAAQAAVAIENAHLRQERDRFFATASHELGNAVAGVQVWARHLLRKRPRPQEEWEDGAHRILKGAENAHRLIEDLLSLSKIQEGRLTLTSWPVDLREAAAEAIAHVQPEADAAGVQVELLAQDGRTCVDSDPTRVRQILLNLLGNATKFTPAGGRIRVGVDADGDETCVAWVSDDGPGVAAEDVERIFRPFEQVSGVARGRGTGLGLPLSRQLARLMGGDLWVETAPGAGATFKLKLPARLPGRAGMAER
jgi:signal transduction histidine kinase